jgi:hypothetical protein
VVNECENVMNVMNECGNAGICKCMRTGVEI